MSAQPTKEMMNLQKLNTTLSFFWVLHMVLLLLPCLYVTGLFATEFLRSSDDSDFFCALYWLGILVCIMLERINCNKLGKLLRTESTKEDIDRLLEKLQKILGIWWCVGLGLTSFLIYLYKELSSKEMNTGGGLGLLIFFLFSLPFLFLALPFLFSIKQYSLMRKITTVADTSPKTDTKQQKKRIPLWEVVLQNDTEELQKVLAEDANINTPYPANGNTPLHIAAWNGYTEITQLLLAQPGIDKEAKNLAGKTPLDLAKEQNHAEIAAMLEMQE